MNQQRDIFVISPILKCIFKNLSAKDLCSCAQVCQIWNSIATIEKSYRKNIEWFLKIGLHEDFDTTRQENAVDFCTDMEHDLEKDLENLRIKPSFCMVFSTSHLYDNLDYVFPSFNEPKKKKMRVANVNKNPFRSLNAMHWEDARSRVLQERCTGHGDFVRETAAGCNSALYYPKVINSTLRRHLPSQCPITLTISSGVIGCNRVLKPVEIEDDLALSGLLLQDYPGVEIKHIPVSTKNFDINCHVGPDTHIKGLLMFLTQRAMSSVNKMVQSCCLKEDSKIAIGGAFVDRTESLLGSVVAFCGENVEAASVILKSNDTKPMIIEKLSAFKDTGLLAHRCVAFMFACICRGYQMYRQYDVESSQFRDLYPNVPIVGVFGSGEIGVNYMPHLPVEHKVLQHGLLKKCVKKFFHSYSTVFVLVSFKEE